MHRWRSGASTPPRVRATRGRFAGRNAPGDPERRYRPRALDYSRRALLYGFPLEDRRGNLLLASVGLERNRFRRSCEPAWLRTARIRRTRSVGSKGRALTTEAVRATHGRAPDV